MFVFFTENMKLRVNKFSICCMSLLTFVFVLVSLILNTWDGNIRELHSRSATNLQHADTQLKEKYSNQIFDAGIPKVNQKTYTIKPLQPPPDMQPFPIILKGIDYKRFFKPIINKRHRHKNEQRFGKFKDQAKHEERQHPSKIKNQQQSPEKSMGRNHANIHHHVQNQLMEQNHANIQHQIYNQKKSLKLMEQSLKTWNTTLSKKSTKENLCHVDCKVGVPCEYKDEVDFRIIVLTMNRASSLRKCLKAISLVHTLNHKLSVDIWVDRSKSGKVDTDTVKVAKLFQRKWRKGRVCIHIRERNAYIGGQWIDTWRPKENTKEIAVIVEDDIDISPYSYFWLHAVHTKFRDKTDIAGYTLQMEHTFFFRGMGDFLAGPKNNSVFLYGVLGTWGFAPHPQQWREFQDWYHGKNSTLKPYVPDLLPTLWYKHAESIGTQNTMWEMWHIYYSYIKKSSTVYCNLHVSTGRDNVYLSLNRKEKGLHWTEGEDIHAPQNRSLLTTWDKKFIKFSEKTAKFEYDDKIVGYI